MTDARQNTTLGLLARIPKASDALLAFQADPPDAAECDTPSPIPARNDHGPSWPDDSTRRKEAYR